MTLSKDGDSQVRINKYIADAGITSRRGAETLINENRVRINGKLVTSLSEKVNIENDTVSIDGENISLPGNYVYIMFNKPKGCVVTMKDEKNRKTVMDYIDITQKRVFPVGRLDYDSEGLLLLTNDGELAYKLTHPAFEVPKTYLVKIEGEATGNELAVLRKGAVIDGKQLNRCKIKFKESKDGIFSYEVTINQGYNRQIRKMFESINKQVVFLKRISVGELRLGGLGRGKSRFLKDFEIEYLKKL
jgi:23S rRNA pseudouridine2605 synthase